MRAATINGHDHRYELEQLLIRARNENNDGREVSDIAEMMRCELDRFRPPEDDEEDAPRPTIEPFEPFPVDALPEKLRGFVVAGSKAIGCDSSYIALPMLAVVAAAIGITRLLRLKRGWTAPAILWTAIVGESGTSKTPAFKLVMRPVRKLQSEAMERHADQMKDFDDECATFERDLAAWKREKNSTTGPPARPVEPAAIRYLVSDTTVEALCPVLLDNPRGVLLARDELAGWLGGFDRYAGGKGGDSAHWLSMYNGEAIIVDRKVGTKRTIYVPDAAVCVTGGIQPGILHRALGREHRESGLAARLLLTCPPRHAKQWRDADIDHQVERAFASVLDELYGLGPIEVDGEMRPGVLGLTTQARAAWIEHYNRHAEEHADLQDEMAAAWSKLEEIPARLALIVHLVRWASGEPVGTADVDLESMQAGIRLTEWFKRETRRVCAILAETEAEQVNRKLVEWIERKGGAVTAREVQQGQRTIKSAKEAEEVLSTLVSTKLGFWRESPPTSRGGRPTRQFVLGGFVDSRQNVYGTDFDASARKANGYVDENGSVDS